MIKQIVALVLAVLALAGNAVSADLDLTSCGTVVPAMANARLPADLDCSTAAGPGVVLEMGAALDLNGFTLVGNPSAFGANSRSSADDGVNLNRAFVEGAGKIPLSGITYRIAAFVREFIWPRVHVVRAGRHFGAGRAHGA